MKKSGYKLRIFRNTFLTFLSIIFSLSLAFGQSCDYQTGIVSFQASGGNNTDVYTTKYILADQQGLILSISNITEFDILTEGLYSIYSINYKTDSAISGIAVDSYVSNITGDCLDVGNPYVITVCEALDPCNYCFGEDVNLNISGGSNSPGFVTKYFLTDKFGTILIIQDESNFTELDTGIYVAFAINYDSSEGITGLEVGSNIVNIQGVCKDISNGFVIGICMGLQPTIFFDLKSCDITETALLQIGEVYDSYLWNTGATSSFIVVPADEIATYTVTVSLASGCIGIAQQPIRGTEIATIGDFVFEDLNGNGIQDPGESGINGVTVNLYTDFNNDGRPDFSDFPSCTFITINHPDTGEPGYYLFNVYRSSYIIEFVSPTGFLPTLADQGGDDEKDSDANESGFSPSIAVLSDEHVRSVDAGFITSSSVCGFVWSDIDGDGIQDASETGVNDISISLYNASGDLISTTITQTDPLSLQDGRYCFDGLIPGEYYVEVQIPEGFIFSLANATGDDTKDSDITGSNGAFTTDLFTTNPGEELQNIDAGIYIGALICGTVWQDVEAGQENVFDPGIDNPLPNVEVKLISVDQDMVISTIESGLDGSYCFNGVNIGSYAVMMGAPGSLSFVQPNVGGDELFDSDVNQNTGTTEVFFVHPADAIFGLNAGVKFGTLPVDLVSFSGYWDRKKDLNILNWQTATEINNDKFEILRAIGDNSVFQRIGEIKGNGNSSTILDYQFFDPDISESANYYYRLKQLDYDGGFAYSDILVIEVERNKTINLRVYPNPAKHQVQLNLTLEDAAISNAILVDITGRIVKNWDLDSFFKGKTELILDIQNLERGQYILKLQVGTKVLHEMIQIIN